MRFTTRVFTSELTDLPINEIEVPETDSMSYGIRLEKVGWVHVGESRKGFVMRTDGGVYVEVIAA